MLRTAALRGGLAAAVLSLGSTAVAQSVSLCDQRARADAIVEPWEANSRTFAKGAVRIAVLDIADPGETAFWLLVVSPPLDAAGSRQCRMIGAAPDLGFALLTLDDVSVDYDADVGILLDFAVAVHDPLSQATSGPITLRVVVDQDTGAVGATLGDVP